MISIKGLDKAEVLYALYHSSSVRGMGFLSARNELSLDACRELIDPWWLPDPTKEALMDKLVAYVARHDDETYRATLLLDRARAIKTEDDLLEVWEECIRQLPRKNRLYFDYLFGRVMKVDLTYDYFEEVLYDRDNGQGAAWAAIDSIRRR